MNHRDGVRNLLLAVAVFAGLAAPAAAEVPPLPEDARLVLDEDWSAGRIDSERWYALRKRWGRGNNGVVPENVRIGRDIVGGTKKNVLVCEAHGDRYDGPVVGWQGQRSRVGGVLVSEEHFASGRYEIVLKIGATEPHAGGPEDPTQPRGAVPAVWTYGYLYVSVPDEEKGSFVPDQPLYNPNMQAYGGGANEYWSELDFPEFGREGDLGLGLYNTFLQNRHDPNEVDVSAAIDGRYHTLTTEWRTTLEPLDGVTDGQVAEHKGYRWVCDESVPFERYLGNPLKRLGPDRYAVYQGERATHWIDGRRVFENRKFVPAMTGQLNLGVWLPDWAGPAPWQTATFTFASVKVWQYGDSGDVRGILTGDIPDNLDAQGGDVK